MSDPFPSRYITANGLRFHYVENGPEGGPPVLLLHGFPEFWYSYRYQLGALGQAGFRAIAPDLRGFNLSDKPSGVESYIMDKLCDDVVELVHALGYKRVTLVGHDWGGAISWFTAASPAHREVVERLVILNAPHPAVFLSRLSLAQLRRSWYMVLFQLPLIPEHLLSKDCFSGLRRALRRTAHVPGSFSDADLDRYVEAMARPGALTAGLNYYRAIPRSQPWTAPKRLVPVAAPTLLIWGERDVALGKELTYNLSRWVPNLRIEYLPDSGHWVQQEQPEQVSRLLLEFLKETATSPG
jgi:pimeloyl-ACP methyl ester carboxylesterase